MTSTDVGRTSVRAGLQSRTSSFLVCRPAGLKSQRGLNPPHKNVNNGKVILSQLLSAVAEHVLQ